MKTLYVISIAAITLGVSPADPPRASVTKEAADISEAAREEKKPDALFRVDFAEIDGGLPDLEIPALSTGMRTRVVDVRVSPGRAEVALQVDELGIAYYDYKLENGKWILKGTKNICALSGALALALAQVDILEGGRVEVAYRGESSGRRASSWADELLSKENRGEAGLLKEEYKLQDGQFVLRGDPVRLRPSVVPNARESEEHNPKAQHPTDGAAEPEKPEE